MVSTVAALKVNQKVQVSDQSSCFYKRVCKIKLFLADLVYVQLHDGKLKRPSLMVFNHTQLVAINEEDSDFIGEKNQMVSVVADFKVNQEVKIADENSCFHERVGTIEVFEGNFVRVRLYRELREKSRRLVTFDYGQLVASNNDGLKR
jgi:hypothetical protein